MIPTLAPRAGRSMSYALERSRVPSEPSSRNREQADPRDPLDRFRVHRPADAQCVGLVRGEKTPRRRWNGSVAPIVGMGDEQDGDARAPMSHREHQSRPLRGRPLLSRRKWGSGPPSLPREALDHLDALYRFARRLTGGDRRRGGPRSRDVHPRHRRLGAVQAPTRTSVRGSFASAEQRTSTHTGVPGGTPSAASRKTSWRRMWPRGSMPTSRSAGGVPQGGRCRSRALRWPWKNASRGDALPEARFIAPRSQRQLAALPGATAPRAPPSSVAGSAGRCGSSPLPLSSIGMPGQSEPMVARAP